MRLRSYYNDSEILANQYTFGQEWQLEDGNEYIGLYHMYIPTGEIYTMGKWSPRDSKKLVKYINLPESVKQYKKIKPDVVTKYDSVSNQMIQVTNDDYAIGYITRYFIKKYNENYISEINKIQYANWGAKKIDPNLYTAISITWYITGEINDVKTSISTIPGVFNKNKKEVLLAELTIPGITKLITNYLQYYQDT